MTNYNEIYSMSKTDKIKSVADECEISEVTARAYLEAEEWNVCDAVYTIQAEKRLGLFFSRN